MATVVVGSSGLTYDRIRVILWYEVVTTNTKVTYRVAVGARGYGSYSTSAALNLTLSGTGQTSYSVSGKGGDFSSGTDIYYLPTSSYYSYSWSRTTSKQTKTINFSLTSTGSTISGTSTGSLSVTIPALPTYTVKYSANGGSGTTTSQTKTYGKSLTLRSALTRTGYTFSKWKASNGTTYSAGASYTKNEGTTMTAQWTPKVYTITLNNQSATSTGTTAYYEKYNTNKYTTSACTTTISTITKPIKTGYSFEGYYTATGGEGTQYINNSGTITASNTQFTANTTLYAKWIVVSYDIIYNLDGGDPLVDPPINYNIESNAITLPSPTRDYYNFVGWIGTDLAEPTQNVIIPKGSTGNREYTAVWERAFTPPSIIISKSNRGIDKGAGANPRYVEDDSGTIPHIAFSWTDGDDAGTTIEYNKYDIIITNQEDSTDIHSITGQNLPQSSPKSLDLYLTTLTIDALRSYDVQIVLHKEKSSASELDYPDSIQTDYISQAYFIMDINGDGTGIGFGISINDDDDFYQALTLTTAPTNWSTTYTNYYVKNNNVYVVNSNSTFDSNTTYYEKIHDSLFKCNMDAAFNEKAIFNENAYFMSNFYCPAMAGMIQMYAGAGSQTVTNGIATTTNVPVGWLLCDGSSLLISEYQTLAATLYDSSTSTYIYGSADAAHFNLPDFRGRTGVGVGTGTSSTATAHTLGQTAGSERVTLTSAQIPEFEGSVYIRGYKTSSTSQRAAIAHGGTGIISVGSVGSNTANGIMATAVADLGSNPLTISFGGGESHNNMQPYVGINYIIATGKTY